MLMPAAATVMPMSSYAERVILQIWKTSLFSSTKSTHGCQTIRIEASLLVQLYYTPYLQLPTCYRYAAPQLVYVTNYLDTAYPKLIQYDHSWPRYNDEFDCASDSHPKTSSSNCPLQTIFLHHCLYIMISRELTREKEKEQRNNLECLLFIQASAKKMH